METSKNFPATPLAYCELTDDLKRCLDEKKLKVVVYHRALDRCVCSVRARLHQNLSLTRPEYRSQHPVIWCYVKSGHKSRVFVDRKTNSVIFIDRTSLAALRFTKQRSVYV